MGCGGARARSWRAGIFRIITITFQRVDMRLLFLSLAFTANAAFAQVVGLGTTQVGATNQLSTAISKVVSDKGLQMRTQPMAGAAQYAQLVNNGDIEFGVSNAAELHYLVRGEVIVEKPNPN